MNHSNLQGSENTRCSIAIIHLVCLPDVFHLSPIVATLMIPHPTMSAPLQALLTSCTSHKNPTTNWLRHTVAIPIAPEKGKTPSTGQDTCIAMHASATPPSNLSTTSTFLRPSSLLLGSIMGRLVSLHSTPRPASCHSEDGRTNIPPVLRSEQRLQVVIASVNGIDCAQGAGPELQKSVSCFTKRQCNAFTQFQLERHLCVAEF